MALKNVEYRIHAEIRPWQGFEERTTRSGGAVSTARGTRTVLPPSLPRLPRVPRLLPAVRPRRAKAGATPAGHEPRLDAVRHLRPVPPRQAGRPALHHAVPGEARQTACWRCRSSTAMPCASRRAAVKPLRNRGCFSMLNLLLDYAQRNQLVTEPGFAPKTIKWLIWLGSERRPAGRHRAGRPIPEKKPRTGVRPLPGAETERTHRRRADAEPVPVGTM
jgi:hypothetical protein